MSNLIGAFAEAARHRGYLDPSAILDAGTAFALVRDMPYQRASSREPDAIIQEWRCTCSREHYLMAGIFRELGMDSRIVMCTHRFTRENTAHFPEALRSLVAKEPVPDVHAYVRVKTDAGWMNVDGTWPAASEPLGMPVEKTFVEGHDMEIACDPVDSFIVPTGDDPQAFKEQLIAEFCASSSTIRDEFIEGMSRWLSDATRG